MCLCHLLSYFACQQGTVRALQYVISFPFQYFVQKRECKPQGSEFLELAPSVFHHYLDMNYCSSEIVNDFKFLLFKQCKVPSNLQSDFKKWAHYLISEVDPFPVPSLVIHPSREYHAVDPPKGIALTIGLYCY
jgi:hypothetical protein